MAFTSDITLTDGATSNVVSAISIQGGETVRRDAARGLVTPYTLRIGTVSRKASGNKLVNSHLVRVDHTFVPDATKPAEVEVASVYFTIIRPQSLASTAIISTMTNQIIDFLDAAAIAKLLNGES